MVQYYSAPPLLETYIGADSPPSSAAPRRTTAIAPAAAPIVKVVESTVALQLWPEVSTMGASPAPVLVSRVCRPGGQSWTSLESLSLLPSNLSLWPADGQGPARTKHGLAFRAKGCGPSECDASVKLALTSKRDRVCSRSEGQEGAVVSLVGPRKNGTFIELGGNTGEFQTNTRFLENCLGWRGFLLEPHPEAFEALCMNRPLAVGIGVGVCIDNRKGMLLSSVIPDRAASARTTAKQRKIDTLLLSTVSASPQHLSNWSKLTFFHTKNRSVETRRVPCAPLHDIVRAIRLRHVDYLSVDVEGAEEDVLRTMPFDDVSVDVVSVEASKATKRKNEAVRALLRSHGFEHVMTVRTWAPKLGDEIFLHERVSRTEEGRRRRKLWRAKMLEARLNAREAWL